MKRMTLAEKRTISVPSSSGVTDGGGRSRDSYGYHGGYGNPGAGRKSNHMRTDRAEAVS